MGYESFVEPGLAAEFRDQFPVTSHLVYLNHAAVSPLCRRAAEAMTWLANDALQYGSNHYQQWLDAYQGLRAAAARLIGAASSEIAIVKNTSEGIATVANGIAWKPGDRIVAFEGEFPANDFPWRRLEARGVKVEWLPYQAPLDRIDEAAKGARLLSISFVQYLSGFRANLEAIGEICHRRGAFFFVDAIQGLGAFPLDVKRCGIHGLAADGHKWLLGPEGCGILYVRQEVQDQVEPLEIGWMNVAGHADFSNREMALRQDAGRYECGTLNTIGIYGLRAAIEFILEVGVDRISPVVQALADRLASAVEQRGYRLMTERTAANGAGIVSFQRDGLDSRMVVRNLREAGFEVAPRQGWVRASPHFYIDANEIDRLAGALP